MLQISSAVAAAHAAGIIHRDLKPANIFVVQRSDVPTVVKVLDFGIAKLAADSLDDDDRQTLTQVGVIIGTPRYMSPEQCKGEKYLTGKSDIYSLGVVFYELLTGELPLGRFPLPSQKVQIDVRLDDVVLRTLEKEPDRRYQHASDVKTDVEKLSAEASNTVFKQRAEILKRLGKAAESDAAAKKATDTPPTTKQDFYLAASSISMWNSTPCSTSPTPWCARISTSSSQISSLKT